MRQNLRYAVRQLRRSPGFTAVAALTIALGVGATTVIFSLVNALLLRPLPVDEPEGLVSVQEMTESRGTRSTFSYPAFLEYRDAEVDEVRLGAYGVGDIALNADGEARRLIGAYVSGDYFELLGLTPTLGRFFTEAEEVARVPAPVAVISHRLWSRRFGSDPDVVGRTVRMNSQPLTVVGVAPADFDGVVTGFATDVWLPIPMYAVLEPGSDIYTPRRQSWLAIFGRLADGAEVGTAEAALEAVAAGITESRDAGRDITGVRLAKLHGIPVPARSSVRLFLALLLATAGLVLLIACVNVAGMLLARATTRQRELGIRLALGAGRRRLIGQLLTETTVLFLIGGVGGVVLAVWLTDLVTLLPAGLPIDLSLDVSPDARVFGFGLLIALGTGLVFGLAPAMRASDPEVGTVINAGTRAVGARSRLRSAFVIGQVAVCLLLLVTAGLLVRSLQSALSIDPGMDAEGVVVASVDIAPHGYDAESGRTFYRRLTEALRASPGVDAVGLAQMVPLTFNQLVRAVEIPGYESADAPSSFEFNTVDEAYFRTVGIPVLEGRPFLPRDRAGSPRAVVINRTMARRFWPDGGAVGQRIRIGANEAEIVGVVADGKYQSLQEEPTPYLYVPFEQSYSSSMMLHVRAAGGTPAVAALMRRELRRLDANVPLIAPAALEDRLRISLLPQKLGATLIGFFGALGLLLAAIGLYGVLAFAVGQRRREIGVRIALGARPGEVLAMVVKQAIRLLVAGLVLGLVLALPASRLLERLLVAVNPTDPATYIGVSVVLGSVALLASYIPARRAARVDPMAVLKAD